MGETILLTSARGFTSQFFVGFFLSTISQTDLRILPRQPSAIPCVGHRYVKVVGGDLTDLASFSYTLQGVIVACHLASEFRDPSHFYATNIEGTKILLSACETYGVLSIKLDEGLRLLNEGE